jgi:serine phosphatase RsbU (regulator of sigma subunit)
MRRLIVILITTCAVHVSQAQPFMMDNIVFENIVFQDADATKYYDEMDKETQFNELLQAIQMAYSGKTPTVLDEIAQNLVFSYSYYYQDELYDALKFNRMASKDLRKNKQPQLDLANKILSVLIFAKYNDVLGAEQILANATSDKTLTRYQLWVYTACLNLKRENYQGAYTNFNNALTVSNNISVFDDFYTHYSVSRIAEELLKKDDHLRYALMADSILANSQGRMLHPDLTYTIKTTPEKELLDSLKSASLLNLAVAYRKNTQYTKSLDLLNKGISNKLNTTDLRGLGDLYLNKGLTLMLMQKHNEASSVLLDALKIFTNLDDASRISETYNLLAKNNYLSGEFGRVVEQCGKSIEYAKQINDMHNLSAAYLILSETYALNNDYVNSQKYYKLYVTSREIIEKQYELMGNGYSNKQIETKVLLQKVEAEIIESEMREIELENAKITAAQKEQEIIFLKQESELREKDLLNKQLEKEQIQRNLQLMKEQLENEQLQVKYIEEQNQKELQMAENANNLNKLELLNTQKEAADKEAALSRLEADASREQRNLFISIFVILTIFLVFLVGFIIRFRKQKRIIEQNAVIINKTNEELVGTIEQVNVQKALIEAKNEEITDSIAYAKRIQKAILPSQKSVSEHFPDCFILFKPKDIVAGDFYWMAAQEKHTLLAVADCTGHGVPGAMVSVVCHGALNRSIKEFNLREPNEILDKTREIVIETFDKSEEDVKDGMDIALCTFNNDRTKLHYAGANNSLYLIRDGEFREIKPDKQPIGKFLESKPFTNHVIDVKAGDCIYLFSDGFADQFGGDKGKKLKYATFKEILLNNHTIPMVDQRTILKNSFEKWRGELEQVDDVCVIGVRL